jgi:hypothetical protein
MRADTAFLAALLLVSAQGAHADAFAAVSGKDRIVLTCEGAAVLDTPCNIAMGQDAPVQAMPVRFATTSTRYAHLLKAGIENAAAGKQSAFPPDAAGLAVLRSLALEKCHPAAGESADMLQLCIPEGTSSSVVLFARGLCDRCGFEPIILRKR